MFLQINIHFIHNYYAAINIYIKKYITLFLKVYPFNKLLYLLLVDLKRNYMFFYAYHQQVWLFSILISLHSLNSIYIGDFIL